MPHPCISKHVDTTRRRGAARGSVRGGSAAGGFFPRVGCPAPARSGRWCGLAGRVRIWKRQGELVAAFIVLLGTEDVGAVEDTSGNGWPLYCSYKQLLGRSKPSPWANGSICGDRGVSVPTPTALCAHEEGSLCPHLRLYVPTKRGLCPRTYSSLCPRRGVSVPAHTALCAHTDSSLCPRRRVSVPTPTAVCAHTYGSLCPHLRLSVPTKRGVFGIE